MLELWARREGKTFNEGLQNEVFHNICFHSFLQFDLSDCCRCQSSFNKLFSFCRDAVRRLGKLWQLAKKEEVKSFQTLTRESKMRFKYSPWGKVQHCHKFCRGIYSVSTAGHGGIYVSPSLNKNIPEEYRNSSGWYEEDLEAAIPMYFLNLPNGKSAWESYQKFYLT